MWKFKFKIWEASFMAVVLIGSVLPDSLPLTSEMLCHLLVEALQYGKNLPDTDTC